MRRFYGTGLLILLLALPGLLNGQAIAFEKSKWKDILARARSERKLIFVDVYATWCGPCKMLDQQVFTDKQVADTYNALFINYKVDAERGEGLTLAQQYNVRAYPTALFIDGEGQLIDSRVGFIAAPEFKQEGERVFRKTPLGLTLHLHETAYNEGNHSSALMKTYLRLRQQAGLPSTELLNDYLSHLPADSLRTPVNTALLLANTKTTNGLAFETLMSRKEEPRFKLAIQEILLNEVSSAGKQRNRAAFTSLCRLVERVEPADQVTERITYYQLLYQLEAQDWKAYAQQAVGYVNQFLLPRLTAEARQLQPVLFEQGYDQLCNISYFVSKYSKDDSSLSALLPILASTDQLAPTPLNTSLQACLQYRLGQKDKAVELQMKALEQVRTKGDDTASYEATLLRMQQKKSL